MCVPYTKIILYIQLQDSKYKIKETNVWVHYKSFIVYPITGQ